MNETPIVLVAGGPEHAGFVRDLSALVFSRFGEYDRTLPPLLAAPWIETVVAQVAGEAVGFAMYSTEEGPPGELELFAIAVQPRWQSRGVGRRLLEAVEAAARRSAPIHAAAAVHLTVAEDNAPALALFRSSGYRAVPGEHGHYDGGQRSISMRKPLD